MLVERYFRDRSSLSLMDHLHNIIIEQITPLGKMVLGKAGSAMGCCSQST